MSEEQGGVPPQLAVYRATIDNLDAALVHLCLLYTSDAADE